MQDGDEVQRIRADDPLAQRGGNRVGRGGHECQRIGARQQRGVVEAVHHRQVLVLDVDEAPRAADRVHPREARAGIAVRRG